MKIEITRHGRLRFEATKPGEEQDLAVLVTEATKAGSINAEAFADAITNGP